MILVQLEIEDYKQFAGKHCFTPTPEGVTMVSGVRSARVRELQRRIEELSPEHRDALVDALPALEELVDETA